MYGNTNLAVRTPRLDEHQSPASIELRFALSTLRAANEYLQVAVPVSQPNVLGYYWAFSPFPGPRYAYQADHFSPTSPASSQFDVPKECGQHAHKPVNIN